MKTEVNSASRKRTVRREAWSAAVRGAHKSKLPTFVAPQLATLVDSVPPGEGWLHEVKLDGYRLLCRIENRQVQLFTRQGQDWTTAFKELADAARRLPVARALI
jgi:bifunctional non-homologous end joining protein LigD